LTDLSDFIHKADQGLLQIVEDYETLVSIMAFLLQVKERAVTTDAMFEPMQSTIDLLKYYDMDIPEEVNVLLQELPEQWNNTKKLAVTVKQQVAPLQATEVISIRNRIQNFDMHINVFRDIFRTYLFFKFDCADPYLLLDRISDDIIRLENDMSAINESGSLFEVNVPEFKLLKQCRRELKMLKVSFIQRDCENSWNMKLYLQQLWDYVFIVQTCIEDWKTTPWRKIDVENMDIECKKFAKDVRLLDKEMRVWDTYIQLEATVKNMLTSLRAVGELQNPAIRERHWQQLMCSTKVIFYFFFSKFIVFSPVSSSKCI
jgi:dynein heavy chain, axonemal